MIAQNFEYETPPPSATLSPSCPQEKQKSWRRHESHPHDETPLATPERLSTSAASPASAELPRKPAPSTSRHDHPSRNRRLATSSSRCPLLAEAASSIGDVQVATWAPSAAA